MNLFNHKDLGNHLRSNVRKSWNTLYVPFDSIYINIRSWLGACDCGVSLSEPGRHWCLYQLRPCI